MRKMSKKIFTIFFCYVIFFLCGTCSKYKTKGEKKVLKIKNQEVLFKVLSCIFAVILIVVMFVNGNVIDLVYLIMVSMFILKYVIEIKKK